MKFELGRRESNAMNPHHRRPPHSVATDFVPPARLCIVPRARKPVYVIIGVSAKARLGMTAQLVREWLAEQFRQPFLENRTEAESSLAVEAFYDELAYHFGDGAFIAAVGLITQKRTAAAAADHAAQPELLECITRIEPITLKFQGLAHAFFNRKAGRAQVTFDHLPGALEFVGRPTRPAPSGVPTPPRREEASAWYGFGTADASHADVIDRLSNAIRHGVIDAELKTRLAEYV